jgi:heme peroxidase
MHVRARNILAATFALVLTPLAARAETQPMFGVLFPDLPAYQAPDDATLARLTAAERLPGVPGPMFDEGFREDDNPDRVPAFFTYFGQFVDHDLTLDVSPLPSGAVDPTTLANGRDQRLNLDSVYGLTRQARPDLYEADHKHLKVNGLDLPRTPDGSAILGDGRNDENQIVAQVHVAFLRAHNALIDQGYRFAEARQLMEWRYQWMIVHEFLPQILDPEVLADVFRPDGAIHTRYYTPKHAARADMPVEFSVAAYRFGHSQVRRSYSMTEGQGFVPVFNGTDIDLHGGRPIAADRLIYWPNFLDIDGVPATGVAGSPANVSRKIDTQLSPGLFMLPIPGAAPGGPSILALRNLQRGRQYGLPSGQAVAAHLGAPVLTNADIAKHIPRISMVRDDPAFLGETPLWLYILAESEIVHDGAKLGPVGSRIVAEVFGGLIAADKTSYYRRQWTPEGGVFRAQDLLREAGVLPTP